MVESPPAKRLRRDEAEMQQRQAMMAEEDAIYDNPYSRVPEIPGDSLSALENIPRELVWQLIEYAPSSVFSLRMVYFCE